MFGSSELWELEQHPHLWRSRAGGGAVHSIRPDQEDSRFNPSNRLLQAQQKSRPVRRLGEYGVLFDMVAGKIGLQSQRLGERLPRLVEASEQPRIPSSIARPLRDWDATQRLHGRPQSSPRRPSANIAM